MNFKAQISSQALHPSSRTTPIHSLLRIGLVAVQLAAIGLTGLGLSATSRVAVAAPSQITGTVFEDFNANGVQDTSTSLANDGSGVIGVATDRGVGGVTVTAYDATGTSVGSTTSVAPSGAYTINIASSAGPYRIEFSTLPTGYQPSFHSPTASGGVNGTSTQFVPDGNTANVNFGIVQPGNYCQNNPTLYVNCYHFGAANGANSGQAALYSFPYSAGSNGATVPPYDTPAPAPRATVGQIGATYGLAYARGTQRVYASAYFKKHAGFGSGANGTLNDTDDAGAIYVINPATNAVVGTFTVPNATTNSHNTADYFNDNGNTAWDAVGKTSLGGIALSPNESVLYVMNLENRTLYALNAATGAVVTSAATPLTLPLPAGGTCANANTRPFAVSVYNNTGYIGLTCTGPTTAELQGYIYTFDLTTLAFSAAPVFQMAFNYPRGIGNTDPVIPGSTQTAVWNPWVSVFTAKPPSFGDPNGGFPVYPQPVLANIAFDIDGSLILGIRDRFGDQTGNESPSDPANPANLYAGVVAGDTLRACGSPSVGWTLESNARCGGTGTGPQNNGQGPGNGEFYWRDEYLPFHDEVSLGAVAQIPGYPDVVVATYNPVPINGTNDTTFDSGVRWMNNTSGDFGKGYRVYNGTLAQGNLFGKAAGLGDLAVLCDAAPIELGNRVWTDTNGNGRQDPGEAGINGVTVGLYDAGGNLLVTTVTSVDGNYYFTATNAAGTNRIQPNTGYQIRVDNTQPALASLALTTPNSVAGGNGVSDTSNNAISDVRDSDFISNTTFAQLIYTTGGAGATNHGLDAGYTSVVVQYDWGDNPDTGAGTGAGNYQTQANDNGARHQIIPNLFMGALVDAEADGQQSVGANGDDLNPVGSPDDEDGVVVADLSLSQGSAANVRVNVTNLTASPGILCGYIDFNGDGDFTDPGENASLPVPEGSNNVQFTLPFGTVPSGAAAATYARFRLSLNEVCASVGLENSGEVEDYPIVINPAPRVSVGDLVWYDTNNDGLFNNSEVGVQGVAVNLYQDTDANCVFSAGDTFIGTTSTDSNGIYGFSNLTPTVGASTAYLVVLPATNFQGSGPLVNYQNSQGDVACGVANENNRDHGIVNGALGSGGTVSSRAISVPTGSNLTFDFGFYNLTLGNLVWNDANNNGTRDSGESGASGITVELLNAAGTTVLATTTTDANGIYTFTGLLSDTYRARITIPAVLGESSDDIATTADPNNNVDNDDNGVGSGSGVVTSNPITLVPGSAGATGANIVVNATGSTTNPTLDFGIFGDGGQGGGNLPVNLGNQVWFDTNNNGLLDAGEVGVPGVLVELYRDANGNGVYDAGDVFSGTQTTIAGGYYTFTNLAPSTSATSMYLVVISSTNFTAGGPLVNYRNSDVTFPPSRNAADDNKNHGVTLPAFNVVASTAISLTSGNQPFTTTNPGDSNWTIDFGFYTLSLGDLVWDDLNNNGLRDGGESGLPNVSVQLLTGAGVPITTTTTDANGNYIFTNLISGTYRVRITTPVGYVSSTDIASTANPDNNIDNDDNGVGNTSGVITSNPITLIPGSPGAAGNNVVTPGNGGTYNPTLDFGVWRPAALGDYVWEDVNKNGIQDEPPSDGRNGVTVQLYQNGVVISTTTTANDSGGNPGYYLFDNLLPGTYSVTFQLPTGFNFTIQNAGGDDGKDSDANPTTGATGDYTLAPGDRTLTVDAGLVRIADELAGLGDFVWLDLNKNGIQDNGEPGVPNITVTLYNQAGTVLDTRLTNASGYYSFTGLIPGTYQVGFTLPNGYTFTIPNAGSNDQIDSDADLTTGRTPLVTLAPGEYNPTLDAGLIPPLARLGDFVWLDINKNGIQDAGEPGIPGITVTLRTPSGTVLSTTLTNGSGLYLFDNLQPDSYVVCFALPPGYVFSPPNQGGDDGRDSDADMITGCAPVVTLGPGESNLTIDAGMYLEVGSPQLQLLKRSAPGTGATVKAGDLITYTITVSNTGNAAANNVRISDPVPTETTYVAGSAAPALESGPSPLVWNVGTLNPGQARTVTFVVRVNSGGASNILNTAGADSDETPPTPSNEVLNPRTPTAVTLIAFDAVAQTGGGAKVTWRTSLESNTFGFYVLRSVTGKLDDAVRANVEIILAKGAGSYSYFDKPGEANNTYWLQEVEVTGNVLVYNPVVAKAAIGADPITSPQPPQPSRGIIIVATGNNAGGVPVTVGNTAAASPAVVPAAAISSTGPAVLGVQPAVITTGNEQGQPKAAEQPATKPVEADAVARTETQSTTTEAVLPQTAQTSPMAIPDSSGTTVAEAWLTEGEAVGAAKAVEVARGGVEAQPRIAAEAATAQAARVNGWLPGLMGLALVALLSFGGAGAYVIRRRRMQQDLRE
jgi:uncharacterized repeat protein (TIGR01451 family)